MSDLNLNELKVGDTVAVVYPGSGISYVLSSKVQKVNKVTIKVDGRLYWKDSGMQKGESWNSLYIVSVEDGEQIIKQNKERRQLEKINKAIQALDLVASPELIEDLKQIMDKHKNPSV